MANQDEWSTVLSCPTCGASFGIIELRPERRFPTVKDGLPGPEWVEEGECQCLTCGSRFSFTSEEVHDDSTGA